MKPLTVRRAVPVIFLSAIGEKSAAMTVRQIMTIFCH